MAAAGLALALKTWSADVVLCTNGERLNRRQHERLARNDVAVRTEPIARLEERDGLLTPVAFQSGDPLPRDVMFFTTASIRSPTWQ